MSTYRKAVEKVAEQLGDMLPCRWCQTLTKHATLAQYGARCWPCYEAYLHEPKPQLGEQKHRGRTGVQPIAKPDDEAVLIADLERRKREAQRMTDDFTRRATAPARAFSDTRKAAA